MKDWKILVLAALLLLLVVPSMANEWGWDTQPQYTLAVKWVKANDVPQFEMRDGVCIVYVGDNERALEAMDKLLHGCMATGKTVERAENGITVHLHYAPGWKVQKHAKNTIREWTYGFFWKDTTGCHIVVMQRWVVGHELKHCVDGEFHDERGVWLVKVWLVKGG